MNRAQLAEQIEKLRPQMDAFRARITEIYAEFDRDIEPILTPEQKEAYQKRFRAHRGFGPPPEIGGKTTSRSPTTRSSDLLQRPFRTLAYFIVIPMTLERMTTDLKLDDGAAREGEGLPAGCAGRR